MRSSATQALPSAPESHLDHPTWTNDGDAITRSGSDGMATRELPECREDEAVETKDWVRPIAAKRSRSGSETPMAPLVCALRAGQVCMQIGAYQESLRNGEAGSPSPPIRLPVSGLLAQL